MDCGATATITSNAKDCLTKPLPIQQRINGVGGYFKTNIYKATIQWNIEDNKGIPHLVIIPNLFLIPKAPSKLLSPQHWALMAMTTNHDHEEHGALCTMM